ncbi:MAG: hypothetical protein Q7T33_01030 [Dehalococcoidia bacterium]|nr:hypothetical protein [Dehalococcoidia bacterium]
MQRSPPLLWSLRRLVLVRRRSGLAVFALALAAVALFAALQVFTGHGAPIVTTDKADYHPSETVIITGGGFAPGTYYDVPVIRPDGSVVKGDGTLTLGWDTVLTNASGSFIYNYKLDGLLGTYEVRVYPVSWNGNFSETPLASTTFTDSPLVTDFKQCSNENPTLGDCVWIGSILQDNNSMYFESMSTPQRLVLKEVASTSGNVHDLTFSHQATKGGIHSYDWLTSYGQAISGAAAAGIPFNDLNGQACAADIGPPASLAGICTSLRTTGYSFVVSIPDDTYVDGTEGSTLTRITAFEVAFGNRTIKIYGEDPITAASFTSLSHSGPDTGDSDVNYTLTWTSTSETILIELGGHLAVTGTAVGWGWGAGQGASQIGGGPYHFKLSTLDGDSLGSQDNQIKGADVQVYQGKIQIVKNAVPDNAQDFSFTCSGALGSFNLDDDADGTLSNTKMFNTVTPGTYTCTENGPPTFWSLSALVCSDPDSGSSTNLGTRTATIDVDPGETITCTYTNNGSGSIVIIKDAVPNNAQDFSFTCSGSLGSFNLDDDGEVIILSNTKTFSSVAAGSYTCTENGPPAGWALTLLTCIDPDGGSSTSVPTRTATIDLDPAETVTCTYTNAQGSIKIVKDADPDDPQDFCYSGDLPDVNGASPGDFCLDDDADGTLSNTHSANEPPGSYNVSEDAPPSVWNLTSIVCAGDTDGGSIINLGTRTVTIDLDAGESITCTFTNIKLAKITVDKVTTPSGDPQLFSFTVTGPTACGPLSLADATAPAACSNLTSGTYTITETVPTGWSLTGATCVGGPFGPGGGPYTNGANIIVSAGDDITCTFNDTKRGTIIVEKQTNPDGDLQTFTFSGDAAGSISDGQQIVVNNLLPGTYTSTETVPLGWDLTSITCNDTNSSGTGSTATFQLEAGETVKCTFLDTKRGNITITKNAIPDDPVQDFAFNCTPSIGTFTLDDDALPPFSNSQTFTNLLPTTYTCLEMGPPGGWVLTSLVCSDPSGGTTTNLGTATASISLAPGETVSCTFTDTKDGTITIIKDADPDDAQDFSFSGTCFAAFSLDDDTNGTLLNTKTAGHTAGTCTVIEDAPAAGWNLTALVCTDPSGGTTTSVGTRTASIDLAAGESVSCTFTNTKDGTITIVKDAVPDDPQDFSFSGTCFSPFSLDDDANPTLSNTKSAGHAPGSCTVVEDAPVAGWAFTSLSCFDPSGGTTVNTGTRTASIDLAAGETVTCTFTNTKDSTSTIIKDAVPDDPQDFSFSGTCFAAFSLDDDTNPTLSNTKTVGHAPGTCTVIEDGPPAGWALTALVCTDPSGGTTVNVATRTASINFAPGETVSCTFTNTKLGSITIIKDAIPDDPQDFCFSGDLPDVNGASPGDFCLDDDADGTLPNSQTFSNLTPGTYSVTETVPAGWTLTGIVCSDTSPTSTGTGTATIALAAGETVTCTFTNTQQDGTITIIKDAVPDDAQDFSFSGTCFAAFSLDDDTNGTLSNTKTAGHAPGSCTVIEDAPAAGWNLTALVCTDPTPNSTVNIGTRTASIDLAAGETVSCTFTNTKDGTITIIKDAVPDDAQDFAFSGTCFSPFSLDDDTNATLLNTKTTGHAPGACTVIEDAPAATWNLTALVCTDPTSNSTGTVGTRTASIDLAPGETVSCTFTNTKVPTGTGTFIVHKDFSDSNTATVSISVTCVGGATPAVSPLPASDNPDTPAVFTINAVPGGGTTCTATETVPTGYTASQAACAGVAIPASGTASCTITNNVSVGPQVTVIKHVVNDNGGTALASAFTMTVTCPGAPAPFPGAEAPGTTVGCNAGAYSVSESGPAGYTQSNSSGCSGTLAGSQGAICIITNNDDPQSSTPTPTPPVIVGGEVELPVWRGGAGLSGEETASGNLDVLLLAGAGAALIMLMAAALYATKRPDQ